MIIPLPVKKIIDLNNDRTTVDIKKMEKRKDQGYDRGYMLKADSPAFSAKTEF